MAKGQKRSSREAKKPKQDKAAVKKEPLLGSQASFAASKAAGLGAKGKG